MGWHSCSSQATEMCTVVQSSFALYRVHEFAMFGALQPCDMQHSDCDPIKPMSQACRAICARQCANAIVTSPWCKHVFLYPPGKAPACTAVQTMSLL